MPKVWQPDSRSPTGGYMKEQGKDKAAGGPSGHEGEVSDLGAVARARGRNKTQTPVEKQDLDDMTDEEKKNRRKMKGLGDALAGSQKRDN